MTEIGEIVATGTEAGTGGDRRDRAPRCHGAGSRRSKGRTITGLRDHQGETEIGRRCLRRGVEIQPLEIGIGGGHLRRSAKSLLRLGEATGE